MDWVTPIGTALGAAAGIGSTVVTERARWSLGRKDRKRDALKAAYIAFLTNITKAGEQVWHAAREHPPGWQDAIMTALRDQDVQSARFSLTLEAPASVREQAEDLVDCFISWRNVAHQGSCRGEAAFDEAWLAYRTSRSALQDVMRPTLGSIG
jgi:hypothetical protein